MNKLRIKRGMVVGSAESGKWSQIYVSREESGVLAILVSLSYEGESELVDLASLGGELLENLKLKGKLDDDFMVDIGQGIEVGLLMVELVGDKIRIGGIGEVGAMLARGEKVAEIYQGKRDLSKVEGPFAVGDKLIVYTNQLKRKIGLTEMMELVKSGVERTEELAVMVHKNTKTGNMAAALMQVEEGRVVAETERGNVLVKTLLSQVASRLARPKALVINREKSRHNLVIGSVLLILLAGGIVAGMVKRVGMARAREYEKVQEIVTQNIKDARSIGDLNTERAKALLEQANKEIELYKSTTDDTGYLERASELEQILEQATQEIFKRKEVTLNTFVEQTIFGTEEKASSMYLDESGNIYLPSLSSAKIQVINARDKSTFTIDLGELGKAKELAFFGKKTMALVTQGIAELGQENRIVIEPDDLWGEIAYLDMFAGNVYLLDKTQSEVWKYPVLDNGFGTRRRWFAPGLVVDLASAVDMKVDGDVWILTQSGKIQRMSRGVTVQFSMEGTPFISGDKLSSPSALYVTEGEVYVLENGSNRVMVYDKESGKYRRQYVAEQFGLGLDIVVNEDKVYVLLDERIVWFEI